MGSISKDLLSMAGEYRVCSELLKRNVFATVTYGNRKAVDVYAIGDRKNKAVRVEVKTSQTKRFVTGISQKKGLADGSDAPDFWVLCQMRPGDDGEVRERFFVLTHTEISGVQKNVNDAYITKFKKKHGKSPKLTGGVDKVKLELVAKYEDAWDKIVKAVG